MMPKTVSDFSVLSSVWGDEKGVDFNALDSLSDKNLYLLYHELGEFRSWASIGDLFRWNIIDKNVESLIRIRWLRSQI